MVQGLSALYRTGQQDAIRVDSTLIREGAPSVFGSLSSWSEWLGKHPARLQSPISGGVPGLPCI